MKARVWKRGKGKWVLIVSGEDSQGKPRTKWTTFPTKADANAAMHELLRSGQQYITNGRMTLEAWLDQWLRDYLVDVKPATQANYASHTKPWRASLGHLSLERLRSHHIQSVVTQLLEDRKASTVAAYCRALSVALSQAVEIGLIHSNPASQVKVPRTTPKAVMPLERAQIAQILEQMAGTTFYLPTLIAVSTGMRRSECLNLRWADIDLEAGTISVVESKSQRGRRMVTMPASLTEELRTEVKRQAASKLLHGPSYQHEDRVCCRPNGSAIPEQSLSHKFRKVVRALGIEATFHDTRHTHASMLLRAGVNIKVIQERLGHANISETLDTYSHLYQGMQDQASEAIEACLP